MNRRRFLLQSATGLGTAWTVAHWPALLSAAAHARNSVRAATAPKFEFFTSEQAREIDAITARIIPTDDSPGAHEAGVVYFIDRALVTFAVSSQSAYRDGLVELQARVKQLYPMVEKFSEATSQQQDEVLTTLDLHGRNRARAFGAAPEMQNFFEIVRQHAIAGFLIDPDTRGNPNGVGWQLIGRERAHMFSSPFGFYDRDYPGWQPAQKTAEKK